jgi:2-amino-4-hydroxy-6-hydroxymethyldihydropteridine diphosphokinase
MMVAMGRARAWIGLGANLGDAAATLAAAAAALRALPGVSRPAVSSLYRTRPVGLEEQPDFRNAVVGLDVPSDPRPDEAAMALLVALKAIEQALGRRERERWGPREVDLDLLVFGRHRLSLERAPAARTADPARGGTQWLEVPHPAARERLFVLAPLAELAPGLRPPGWGETVESARRRALAREGPEAVERIGSWHEPSRRWRPSSTGA